MKIYNDVTIIIIYAFLHLHFGVYMNQIHGEKKLF